MADGKAQTSEGAAIGFEGAGPSGGSGLPPDAGPAPPPGASAAPPPSYNQAVPPSGGFILSYVDFVPTQNERFSDLLNRANQYLASNPGLKPKSCESYEVKGEASGFFSVSNIHVDSTASGYIEWGKRTNFYVRCLRLWLEPKQPGETPEPVVLGYTTAVPGCLDKGGFLSWPKFEEFHVMVGKLNQYLQQNPLQGRVLNMDTQEIKFHTWSGAIDPDETFWVERQHATFFLSILRIVYIVGTPAYETIGAADFVPGCIDQGGFASWPRFEPFMNIATNAHNWLKQNPDKRFTNIQTVQYKLQRSLFSSGSLNTQCTIHYNTGKHGVMFVRILRAYFTTSQQYAPDPVPHLTYRSFHPACLRTGGMMSWPMFENQPQNLQRLMAYLNYTRAKVFAVETVPVKIWAGGSFGDIENSLEYDSPNADYRVFVMRLFLDGQYHEPPPEAMPAMPQVAQGNNDCCNIM